MNDGVRTLLERQPGWPEALKRLAELNDTYGSQAVADATRYADHYRGRRAAMVFDVVASRQRTYKNRVLPWVERFEATPPARSLAALASIGPPLEGLRRGEADTMRDVASGLLQFGTDHRVQGDDATVEAWAGTVAPLELAPALDPYVGSVAGIGIALFAYLRMQSGANALKPDGRVRAAIKSLGFPVPRGEAALLTLGGLLRTNSLFPASCWISCSGLCRSRSYEFVWLSVVACTVLP